MPRLSDDEGPVSHEGHGAFFTTSGYEVRTLTAADYPGKDVTMSVDTIGGTPPPTRDPRSAPEGPGARNSACAARPAPGPAGAEPGTPQAAPLVYRKQSRGTSDSDVRRARFIRRAQSSAWLISDVHEALHIVDEDTGEITMDWPRAPRLAKCSWRRDVTVPVHAAAGRAHYSGLERCSSIWACPVCAAVVRAERAREIEKAVTAHHEAGGSALFVTLTIRHGREDPLAQSLDAVLKSWQKILGSRAWRGGKRETGMRERFGVTGYIRSTEVTHGDNGWHPHIHAVILLENDLPESEVARFGDAIHRDWARYVQAATGKRPDREHGTDVQKVDRDGKVLARYLSKMQDEGHGAKSWGVAAELARADVKAARRGGVVPFELLDEDHPLPRSQRHALWTEYVAGTKGRRAITWSRGLKAAFEIDDRSDEEIIEDTEAAPPRWIADGEGYDALRHKDPKSLAVVLELAEVERWDAVAELLPGRPVDSAVVGEQDDENPDAVVLACEKFEALCAPLHATVRDHLSPGTGGASAVHGDRLRSLALRVGERLETPDLRQQFLDHIDQRSLTLLRVCLRVASDYVPRPSTRVTTGLENLRACLGTSWDM